MANNPTRDNGLLSTETSNTDTHTVDMPSGGPGDRLYVVIGSVSNEQRFVTPSGWTFLDEAEEVDASTLVFWKDDAGETTVEVSSGADSFESVSHCWRVSGDADPDVTAPDSAYAYSATGNANPPSVNVTGGPKDVLVLVSATVDNSDEPTSPPSGYANFVSSGTGSGSSNVGGGYADLAINSISSENPGAFSGSDDSNVGFTIILHPAPGGGGDDDFPIWHRQNQERENTLLRM